MNPFPIMYFNPVLSVIIPVFNREELICRTIASVRNQSYKNWECIIVDDYSTDKTYFTVINVIKEDNRFRIIRNDRKKGAQGARNCGLLESKGKYITFFDSDDSMLPERFEKQIAVLNDNPDIDICTCYSFITNESNERIGALKWETSGEILKNLLMGNTYVDFNSPVIRREKFDLIGVLDEECPSFQEWDTHIRLASVSKYDTVREFLISYYQSKAERISNDRKREIAGLMYIYHKHRELWIQIAGDNSFASRLYSLKLYIPESDRESVIKFNEVFDGNLKIPVHVKTGIRFREYLYRLKKDLRKFLFPVIKIIKYR